MSIKPKNHSDNSITMPKPLALAIMQPYIFPYIGYFHLIQAVDYFVFYDDVNFIKRGWINRNKLLNNGKDWLMTVPLHKASQNDLIKDVYIHPELYPKWKEKTLQTIQHNYSRAPHFKPVFQMVEEVFNAPHQTISDLAIASVVTVCRYLGTDLQHDRSSKISPESQGMDKADRLIHITKKLGYTHYVNAIGGKELYKKDHFKEKGIKLHFVQPEAVNYRQFDNGFVPWLSIIDVLMFNDIDKVKVLLKAYRLV